MVLKGAFLEAWSGHPPVIQLNGAIECTPYSEYPLADELGVNV